MNEITLILICDVHGDEDEVTVNVQTNDAYCTHGGSWRMSPADVEELLVDTYSRELC